MRKPMRDIFICHASEDKDDIVRPMVEAINQAGISCWYDEAEIQWGDSITQNVNKGLSTSRYVIVVLSTSFMQKNWPQKELNAVLNQEASTGEVKVLPLLVGSEQEKKIILEQYPLLNDKRYLPWGGDLNEIVASLRSLLRYKEDVLPVESSEISPRSALRIPIPKIKKKFTQRDRDFFLRNGFTVIRKYFQDALQELGRHYKEVETDFSDVHNFKFVSTIYVRGDIANKCKIWIGGLASSDSIAYQTGQVSIEGDDSFNDILSISDDMNSLGFQPSGMWFSGQQYSGKELLTAEQAAEYLWQRFTESLG